MNKQYRKPTDDREFEKLCHQLFGEARQMADITFFGRSGQAQKGIDLIGTSIGRRVAIQCKCYHNKQFTVNVVEKDVKLVDASDLEIDELIFATTAASSAAVVSHVLKISRQRSDLGKFTITLQFWDDIEALLCRYPNVAEMLEPSTLKAISDRLAIVEANTTPFDLSPSTNDQINTVIEMMHGGKFKDALNLLSTMEEPIKLVDVVLQSRRKSLIAICELYFDHTDIAAKAFNEAYHLAPKTERGYGAEIRHFLLTQKPSRALDICNDGLELFPESAYLWGLKINILDLLHGEVDESCMPVAVASQNEIAHSLAHSYLNIRQFRSAFVKAKQYFEANPTHYDAKRLLLVTAVSWALEDPVKGHNQHLSLAQREALKTAVESLGNCLHFLMSIQSSNAQCEIANNLSLVYRCIGRPDEAKNILRQALPLITFTKDMERNKLYWLDALEEFGTIETSFTDYTQYDVAFLLLLAEHFASHGNTHLFANVVAAISESIISENQRDLLVSLDVMLLVNTDQELLATQKIEYAFSTNIKNQHLLLYLAQIEANKGRVQEAEGYLNRLVSVITPADTAFNLLAADTYLKIGAFKKAAELYSRIVTAPGPDNITYHFIESLLKSHQRSKAKQVLDSIPEKLKDNDVISRLEASLAWEVGDWASLLSIANKRLVTNANDGQARLDRARALHGVDDRESLLEELDRDIPLQGCAADREFEYAKVQMRYGFAALAINRMTRVFLKDVSNSTTAGYLLIIRFMAGGYRSTAMTTIDSPVAVKLGNALVQPFWIVIADDIDKAISDLFATSSDIAKTLNGCRLGDEVVLPQGYLNGPLSIQAIASIQDFALELAKTRLQQSVLHNGPAYALPATDNSGDLPIELIVEQARQRREFSNVVFDAYRTSGLPISLVAQSLRVDIVSMLVFWPGDQVPMYVSKGDQEEIDHEARAVRTLKSGLVLDFSALTAIASFSLQLPINKLNTTLYVPQSLKDEIVEIKASPKGRDGHSLWIDDEDRLHLSKTPHSLCAQLDSTLDEILYFIKTQCTIAPAIGPSEPSDYIVALSSDLPKSSIDVIYLAQEKDLVLFSEDLNMRLCARDAGVECTVSLRAVMGVLKQQGSVTHEKYRSVIFEKLRKGHTFIQINANDLYEEALKTPRKISPNVERSIATLRSPLLIVDTGIEVAAAFLGKLSPAFNIEIVVKYRNLFAAALTEGRADKTNILAKLATKLLLQISPERRNA